MSNPGVLRQIQNINDYAVGGKPTLDLKPQVSSAVVKNLKFLATAEEGSKNNRRGIKSFEAVKTIAEQKNKKKNSRLSKTNKKVNKEKLKDVGEKIDEGSKISTAAIGIQVELTDKCWLALSTENWIEIERENYVKLQQKLDLLNEEIQDEEQDVLELINYIESTVREGERRLEKNNADQVESSTNPEKIDLDMSKDLGNKRSLNCSVEESVQTVLTYGDEIETYPDSYWEMFKSEHDLWMEQGLTTELEMAQQYLEQEVAVVEEGNRLLSNYLKKINLSMKYDDNVPEKSSFLEQNRSITKKNN